MAIFKSISASDKKTTRSFLNQLIDVLQQDISSSISRRKYQVFVTGGIGPGVTSSLYQTVYDQDFTLQTANPIFDVTVGLAPPDVLPDGIADVASTGYDDRGKYLYPSSSLMMREKTDIYGQFAQTLLGDRANLFTLPVDATSVSSANTDFTNVDAALFIAFKRLFSRDQIKRETFAMKFFVTASGVNKTGGSATLDALPPTSDTSGQTNLYINSTTGSAIFTDVGSNGTTRFFAPGGQYGYLVNAAATKNAVGIMYYDSGIAVLDIQKIVSGSQFVSGAIDAMTYTGQTMLGGKGTETEKKSNVVPDLLVSGSVDNIIDHLCFTRFGSGVNTAITFQNVTNINSSLIFCRVLPDDFNYSSNPTYVKTTGDDAGRLTIYDNRVADELQEPFTYITTIGLYDGSEGLLAVAKLSRPVEKNPGRDLTLRVRLDF